MFQFPIKSIYVTTRFILYSPFGKKTMHYGMDYGCATGTPVYAANAGQAVVSGWDSGGGNMIAIQGDYELSRYAHLSKRLVAVGAAVNRGQLIGYSGNTGSATTGAHLHFETWLIPKGYQYKFADRPIYAVDPMSVCHLLSGQTFDYGKCQTCTPIPYPEPKPESLTPISGVVKIKDGAVRLRTYPEASAYQYVVGGYNRGNDVLGKLLKDQEYVATYKCVNGGYTWALMSTERGPLWVALLAGKTELAGETPVGPTDDDLQKQIDALTAENAELKLENASLDITVLNYRGRFDQIGALAKYE